MRATPHLLDDEERTQVVEVRFPATGGSGRAHAAVDVQAGSENRRVAHTTGNLPRQTARRRHAADVAAGVDAVAVDGAEIMIGIDESFAHHLQSRVVPRLRALL